MLHIQISILNQTLQLWENDLLLHTYPVSTAKNGIGFQEGSYCTPIGNFIISEKIGHHAPLYTIFKGRVAESIWDPAHQCQADLITTRILWLEGTDHENANTKDRYIYIHGTNHEDKLGTPASCGCIRMHNEDIIQLFDLTPTNTSLVIN